MTPDPHWLDNPINVRRLWRGFLGVLALTVVVELVIVLHPHFAVDALFGFHAWFGFLSCVLMIAGAKLLAHWLKRPDAYYGSKDD